MYYDYDEKIDNARMVMIDRLWENQFGRDIQMNEREVFWMERKLRRRSASVTKMRLGAALCRSLGLRSYQTASKLIDRVKDMGLIEKSSGQRNANEQIYTVPETVQLSIYTIKKQEKKVDLVMRAQEANPNDHAAGKEFLKDIEIIHLGEDTPLYHNAFDPVNEDIFFKNIEDMVARFRAQKKGNESNEASM